MALSLLDVLDVLNVFDKAPRVPDKALLCRAVDLRGRVDRLLILLSTIFTLFRVTRVISLCSDRVL